MPTTEIKLLELNFHADRSHAWLEVPLTLLSELGLWEEISFYSYRDKRFAYLEEDCDAELFIAAVRASGRYELSFRETFQDWSPIRDKRHFR